MNGSSFAVNDFLSHLVYRRRPFHSMQSSENDVVSGIIVGDRVGLNDSGLGPVLDHRFLLFFSRTLYHLIFSYSVFSELLLFRGRGTLLNCMTLDDPARLCCSETDDGFGPLFYLGLRRSNSFEPSVLELVSLAVVESESQGGTFKEHIHAQLPKMFVERLSSVVHIGFGRFSSFLAVHFLPALGFRFTYCKFPSRLFGMCRNEFADPSGFSDDATTTKLYDGRYCSMNLHDVSPYKPLPSFGGHFRAGDLIWLGFHVKSRDLFGSLRGVVELSAVWVVLLYRKDPYVPVIVDLD